MENESGKSTAVIPALYCALVLVMLSAGIADSHTRIKSGAFDWELFAIILTGFGTTSLAGVTGFLAYETREDVRASRKTADAAIAQTEILVRPLLVGHGTGHEDSGPTATTLHVHVRNVGSGPALIPFEPRFRRARGSGTGAATWPIRTPWQSGTAESRVVVSLEVDRLIFTVVPRLDGDFYVDVVYTDLNGLQPQRTTLYIERDGATFEPRGVKLERLVETVRDAQAAMPPVLSGYGWNLDKPDQMER